MPAPQNAPLPPFFTLTRGMVVRITALDAATGNAIGGVSLSNMALSVGQEDDGPPPQAVELDPAFLPGVEQLV